jgi:flagellar biosynthesis protein
MRRHSRKITPDQAVALRYRKELDRAPTVVAKGRGVIAERIREIAREHGIQVQEDSDLVELLAKVDLDREIPAELYAAVAEILAWVYRANDAMRKEIVS